MRAFYKLRYYTLFNNQITIPAGSTAKVVTVTNIPPMGLVHKVVGQQTAGASVAFNIDLLDFDPTAPTTPPPDLSRIINTVTATAGNTASFSSDHGVPFVLPDKKLYIRVWLDSAQGAAVSFDLAVVLATND